jgi:hypothetical protein
LLLRQLCRFAKFDDSRGEGKKNPFFQKRDKQDEDDDKEKRLKENPFKPRKREFKNDKDFKKEGFIRKED